MRRLKQSIPIKTKRSRADSSDVLGTNVGKPRIPSKWRAQYKRLTDLRNHFLDKRRDLARDAVEERPSYSMHMADAGTDTYDQDWALSMLSAEQSALYEIEGALARIKDGSYGTCEITGKRIEVARLEAIPWTRYSPEGVKELELQGKMERTKLGERGSWREVATPNKPTPGRRRNQ